MLRQDSSRMRRFAVQSGVIAVAVLMLATASIIAVDTSSAFGVTSPTVISITPNNAVRGNNSVWVTIGGTGFVAGAGNLTVVQLVVGGRTIRASNVIVSSANTMTCRLNLLNAPVGAGNVVVTNPDGGSGTLLNGFTVTP